MISALNVTPRYARPVIQALSSGLCVLMTKNVPLASVKPTKPYDTLILLLDGINILIPLVIIPSSATTM